MPLYLAYDNNKYFVIFDHFHCVYVFDENGGLLYTIGQKGSEPGQFIDPFGLAVFGGNMLLVCDYKNPRVQLFNQDGTFISSFGEHGSNLGQLDSPIDVAVAQDGQIFVLESGGPKNP